MPNMLLKQMSRPRNRQAINTGVFVTMRTLN